MNSRDIAPLPVRAHAPEVISSTDDARAVAWASPARQSPSDHHVDGRAWVTVVIGEVEFTATAADREVRQ